MVIIESNIPLPAKRKAVTKLSAKAKEIAGVLAVCKDGDSFVIDGEYKAIASLAGRLARPFGASVKTATAGAGMTRVWRIPMVVKKAKASA